MNKILTSNP